MKSRTTARFWSCFERLPPNVRRQTRQAYKLWLENPRHPSLKFKRLKTANPVYSIRIGSTWRALGVVEGNTIVWFWIGSHADYDRLISKL